MHIPQRGILWVGAGALLLVVGGCIAGGIGGCAVPRYAPALPAIQTPQLNHAYAVMSDGIALPVRAWKPEDAPRAVVLGLHGFNDYSQSYANAGEYLAARGIATYAYDQRGFGAAPFRGLWAGHAQLVRDARSMLALLARHHEDVPIYVMGESMGGAVALLALNAHEAPVAGLILAAPAVWGRATMNPLQRALLAGLVRFAPGWQLSGAGLRVTASDNAQMLRALHADPLVIKRTRVDAIYGLVGLMDAAAAAAHQLRPPTLILYGARDEVIPPQPTCRFLRKLPPRGEWRVAYYPDGYHLLTRDRQAEVVLHDVAQWVARPHDPLPSGFEQDVPQWTHALCD